MRRLARLPLLLAVVCLSPTVAPPATAAWPHRAIVTAVGDRPVAFRAHPRGGTLVVPVDAPGRRVAPSAFPTLQTLTDADTIRARTPADFPLDLSKGPVVFIADGSDSLHVTVGRNPYGSIDRVSAKGQRLTLRLVADKFVIDSR